MGLRSLVFT